ncbi:TonB-dependent receptor [Novosphingobium soli]|uniref:TonB-dependent receptor n=1 Tax=Novosphingobium soli TaxID=574956 RepID=A0ABV6CWS6_9SPHN
MRKSMLLLAASGCALACPVAGQAQEAAARPAEAPRVENGDIIVTARKRQESVLKVPVIETVLSPEILSKAQVTDITGITNQVAGLQVGNNVLTVGTQISLRGVGTSSLDAGVDQSVSLNIDGLQLTQGATYAVGLFDMAQVEVLKGPQALFFGKNSPGGVISIRTADPGDEAELIARASYLFESRERRGELIYSAPLSDTVGFRFAGMYSKDDGYFRNRATALPGTGAVDPSSKRYNGGDEFIVRGTFVWEPDDSFSLRLKANATEKRITGGSSAYGSCPDGNGAPAGIPFINPADDCRVDRDIYIVDLDPAAFPSARNGGVPFMKYQTQFGTLEMNYEVAPLLTLTSTTGYFNTTVDGFINGVNTGYAGPSLMADNHFTRRDYTQELRLQSDFSSALNFLLGGYYQDGRITNRVFVGGNLALFGSPAFTTLTAGINDVGIDAYSGFGQLRWRPAETLEIAGGVRYTDEKRHDDGYTLTGIDATPVTVTVGQPDIRSKNWSPELTITYTPTDDLTIFGALKQGYKSGSFIMTTPPAEGVDNSFGDEKVRGGEIGVKARLADRTVTVNTAFYYYKYSDLQVGANEVASGGLPVIRTINAASSKVYGIDFEATYRPPAFEGLSARLAVNWNHARFTTFDNAPCWGGQRIQDGCDRFFNEDTGLFQAQDLSGVPLPKAADWTATGGVDYETPVGASMKLTLGLNGQYSSKFLRNLGDRADFYQPAFFKLNGNVALAGDTDGWELALIGNNLTNKYTSGNCTQFSGATGQIFLSPLTGGTTRNAAGVDELACIPDRGREVFLRLTLRPFSL